MLLKDNCNTNCRDIKFLDEINHITYYILSLYLLYILTLTIYYHIISLTLFLRFFLYLYFNIINEFLHESFSRADIRTSE